VLLAATAALQLVVYLLQYVVVLGVESPLLRQVAAAFPKWLFAAHLFWFTLGVVVGFEQQTFKALAHRFRWALVVAAAVLFVAGMVEWELLLGWSGSVWVENRQTLIDGLYAGAVILSLLSFTDIRVPFPRLFMDLGAKSFGIYLVHGIAMEFAARAIYHGAPWMLGRQLLFLPVVIGVGVAAPLLLMNLISRSRARPLYPYLFG
jgi:membrane-bound acyltransferase YfiQ involved in biofilm formation